MASLEEAQELGYIGPQSLGDQLRHSRAFAEALLSTGRIDSLLDLGSGGGLPALLFPFLLGETRIVLLESSVRRAAWLAEVVARLRIDGAAVLPERAESAGRRPELAGRFQAVSARAFGPPAVTAECAAPFLEVGGHLLVSEPPRGHLTERWPSGGLELLGFGPAQSLKTGKRSFALMRKTEPTPERYPRRVGIPSKRPLF